MATIDLTTLTTGNVQLIDKKYKWVIPSGSTAGVLDEIIMFVNDNIELQYDNGRIDDDKYAEIYLSALQTTISQGMQFLLQKQMLEAQISGIETDNEIKLLQKAATNIEVLAKKLTLESDFPVDVTVNYDSGEVGSVTSVDTTRLGKVERLVRLEEAKVRLSKVPSVLK